MSHDRRRYDYHGNYQNSDTPRSNGIAGATTNNVVGKSHPAQSMDGATEYESRTARIELNGASTPTGLANAPYNDFSSKRRHHHDHDDIIDIPSGYPRQHVETTNVIGPSVSIPDHLESTRQSRLEFYAEGTDGASVSKSYDVTTDQSDRGKKREAPRQPKVELLTYRPHPDVVETGGDVFQERFVGEADMTLSQHETASEIDAKIVEMMRKRKISQGTSRTPKTTVLPTTKESMKEVMNMAPERKKKSSRAETKRLERKTVHGVPWEPENKPATELERAESARMERDANLMKKLDKRRQKQAKPGAGIKLVGFKRVGDFCTSPPIPEEGEMTSAGIRQSNSLNFMPSDPVAMPTKMGRSAGGKDTISASSSFEFRTAFSPTHTRVSPTQEFVPPRGVASGGPPVMKQKLTAAASVPVTSSFRDADDRTVYRPNLEETYLSDVAVFGKHFDPSQLTQERMEMNVGDISSVGLNQPNPLKKRGERERERGRETGFSSGSLKIDIRHHKGLRSQSESVSPKMKGKGASEEGKLSNWETEVSAHAARHSSVLSTPSRYRMGRVSQTFREPVVDEGDIFGDELPQGSMPDIFRPSKSLSPSHRKTQGVKEGTPDSGTSEEEKPKKKRSIGYALGQKLSTSMRELFSKEKRNPTSGTRWHFEVSSDLYPAPSEPQLSVLTEQERREILEETEVMPRTRSTEVVSSSEPQQQQNTSTPAETGKASGGNPLAHLFVPPPGMSIGKERADVKQSMPSGFYDERSVDVGPRSPRRLVDSDNAEYDTASDSEEGYVKSSVNIITSSPPPDSALRKAGYFTGTEKRENRESSPKTSLTASQTGSTGPQTGLPTIDERSTPGTDAFSGYEMPHSESAPIVKTLEGIVEKKGGKKGKISKSSTSGSVRESVTKKDESKKEKKPIFRFTKSRTVLQRGTHSPRPASPLSVPGSTSGSPRSSGRLSPTQRPGTKPLTAAATAKAANTESTRRGSKTSLGEPSSSPSGSFRGGQISPFSPGGRGGAVSPLRSSIRSATSVTGGPGGLNSGRGRGASSPSPGGSTRSPRGSIQGGSPRGSGRGSKIPSPSGGSPRGSGRGSKISPPSGESPGLKTPSPKTSTQLNVSKKLSPVGQPPSTTATASATKGKRRLSEPFISPSSTSPFSRSPSERHSNASIGSHKPVRKAPPPPAKASQQKTPGSTTVSLSRTSSRTSSQTSTGGGANSSSSSSSPRQRKKGVSMSQSPLSPKRLSSALLEKGAASIAAAGDDVFKTPTDERVQEEDETEKLMKSIRKKLASLSENTPPEDPNPIDHQTQFEVPPPIDPTTPTATPLSPTGSDAKVPTYKLTPSGELKVEGEEEEKKDVEEAEEDFTASVTPGSSRRGLRPKTVISALIGGRGKKKGAAGTVTTKDNSNAPGSGGIFRKGKANASAAEGDTDTKAAASSLSEPKPKTASGKPPQRGGVSSGLPPRGPSVRGGKSGSGIGGGRSQSTIAVPTIQVTETRKSTRKVSSHASVGMATSSGGLRSSRGNALGSQGSLVRSSIRVSSKLKKNNPMSPEHRKISSLGRQKGGERPPSRGSMHSLPRNSTAARVSVRRPVRVAPVAPGRAPSRKASTPVTAAGNENRKTSTANNLDTRRTSVLSKSLRKTSTIRPQAEESLNRSVATRSMRMSSSRRVSALGTMPRSSVVTKVAGGNHQTSSTGAGVARRSMRKVSSQSKDVFDAFDKISADAQGRLLTSSDHRRAVRPKFRQKASSAHLRLLRDREDVTTEMLTPSSDNSGLDPNVYSTYMAKKNLAPSAVAGLSIKLDFTTVKLRKTGISDKMLMDRSTDLSKDLPNFAVGAEYDTKHTTIVLQIKGRRQVHTRLVEPSVTSMNSGDVYIVVSGKSLYHWIGKSANVIEKARGSDVVMRIVHKKELGCQAMAPVVIKEEVRENATSAKIDRFWKLLGGKKGVKSSESVPNDDLYEKSVNMVTTVMHLEGDSEDNAHFTTVHESLNHLLKMGILDTNKILLLDFYSEVYVWVGKASPPKMRKKAIELAKKHFDSGCKPPVFTHQGAGGSTLIRSSGRYRAKTSSTHNPRNSTINRSGRRVSRVRKESAVSTARPSWAMFNRLNEGSEHILFREKFSDWPEQGRIIKMKGHATTPVMPTGPVELQPADVEKMLRSIPKFEGLRLDGDNVHRGQGNYKVSRSSFACNRVHPNSSTKWVIKDNDNVVVPETEHGLFYSQEAYVVRWSYRITVVKELEGLSPGSGMFARERKMQQAAKDREVKDAQTNKSARGNDSSDTESEDEKEERDDESRRMLESGGRDKVAYFFWQGDECTVNEKGASALLTVELDKERGPQVRVIQNKEPPAFLNLFFGGMVILCGRSETMSFKSPVRPVRLFLVRGQMRSEACLVEIDPEHWPLAKFFRSRGSYVVYDSPGNKIFLWKGCRITPTLRKVSHTAARLLKRRLKADLVMVEEGQEPKDMCALIGDKTTYDSLLNDARLMDFTPRLFELSSTTGEFVASEVVYPARDSDIEATPFLQTELYTALQPAIFLLDAYKTVYVWLGWWPQERRDWSIMRETNITTGSAHARWLRDKKLALETAQLYSKASTETRKHKPKTYMVHAGTEPDHFIHLFPFWKPNAKVQELQCKGRKPIPQRIDVEQELLKYSRTQFSLKELQKRPLPEGVDPARLETYISDEEFKSVFGITREQFQRFPAWKQTDIKKVNDLF